MDKNKMINFIKNIKKIEDLQKRKLQENKSQRSYVQRGAFRLHPHHPFTREKHDIYRQVLGFLVPLGQYISQSLRRRTSMISLISLLFYFRNSWRSFLERARVQYFGAALVAALHVHVFADLGRDSLLLLR